MIKGFLGFFKYLCVNIILGKFNLGIIIVGTLSLYTIFLTKFLILQAILTLIIGIALCISYSFYDLDCKNKSNNKDKI